MAIEADRPQASEPTRDRSWAQHRLARHFDAARRNLALSRALLARRRRDRRFRIVPYNAFQILNGAAVILSACLLLVILLDPYFTVWQGTLPEGLVAFFRTLEDFGKADWILVGTGTFFILSALRDAGTLKARLKARKAVRALTALYVFLAVAFSGLTANFAKYALGRARPKHFAESGSFSFDFWSGDAGWASFPSGHATTAMALGAALALIFPRLRWVFLAFGFWVAVSRLFTRAHYPSDVLAGALLGAAVAWLIARALAQHRLVFGFDRLGRLVRRRGASGRLI
jgi:undecaprenyl-diphosphatase